MTRFFNSFFFFFCLKQLPVTISRRVVTGFLLPSFSFLQFFRGLSHALFPFGGGFDRLIDRGFFV